MEAELDPAATRTDAGVAVLLGRNDELAQLYGLIDGIGQRGGALVVRGDPGIGKSALLQAAAARARERDVPVVSTTGIPSEARFAFAGLRELLLPFLDAREHLPEPQRRALETAIGLTDGEAPDPFLVGLAVLGLVTEAETKRPLVFVVDDAHWLDGPSSEVLGFVARRLELEPVIALFAVRDGIGSEVDERSAANLGPDLEARVLDDAAGNPLALIELPAVVASFDGAAAPEALPLPTRLEQAFAARLAGLDGDTRRLLLLAALEHGEIPGLSGDAAWAPSVAAGLGTVENGTFRFRHPLIRSAVAQAATPEERLEAHAALALAFQDDPDREVWHRAAAVTRPDEEIAKALDAAAERAKLRGGRDMALAALERAAELSVDRGSRALRLFGAGRLAYELGRATEATRLLRVAPDDPARLATLALVDPVGRGAEIVRRVTQTAPLDLTDPEEQSQVGSAAAAVWADNLALPFVRAASAGFRADGRLTLLAQTLVVQAWSELQEGAVRVAITAAGEGVQLAEETRQVRYAAAGRLAEAIASVEMGADDPAEQLIGAAEAMLLPLGANPLLSLVALARGRHALAHERFSEAYVHLLRIFDPNDAAYQEFVGGWVLADLADAVLQGNGDLEVLGGILREWEAIATVTGAPLLDVQLRYAKALLADTADAEPLYENAMHAGAKGWPFYAARTQLAYGAWLRRQHRMADSRPPLREAAQSFEALGLVRFAERARRELRASGEAPRRRSPEAWAELTPQELQIAQLAAAGLSNREIGERLYLSHRTVASHLYRLFPKLGITSRAQLRDALGPSLPAPE